jgi:hypothetical protein
VDLGLGSDSLGLRLGDPRTDHGVGRTTRLPLACGP